MRTTVWMACLGVLLVGTACQQRDEDGGAVARQVEQLEDRVEQLEARVNDQALKLRITGSLLGRSPLQNFFDSPEFWENTYDSGQADCANRCIRDAQTHRAECAKKKTEKERLACYEEASRRAATCQQGCIGK